MPSERARSLRHVGLLAVALAAAAPLGAQAPTAAAGPITHSVTGYEIVREIPASWTIPRFQNIAKPKPAPEAHVWYVLRGTTTNGDARERSVNATTFKIVDQAGAAYEPDVKNALYQPEGTAVTHIGVEPGATVEWLAFFAVPESARGLRLLANDLSFVPKAVATFRLPDPSAAAAPRSPDPGPAGGQAAAATAARGPGPAGPPAETPAD